MISQLDPRWAHVAMGDTKHTIGRIGCTISSIAFLNNTTPDVYAKEFRFTLEGLLYWWSVPGFEWRHYSTAGLAETIKNKKVIIEVDKSHWMAVINDTEVMDPLGGHVRKWSIDSPPSPWNKITGYAVLGDKVKNDLELGYEWAKSTNPPLIVSSEPKDPVTVDMLCLVLQRFNKLEK
jgi:hypothetical protein